MRTTTRVGLDSKRQDVYMNKSSHGIENMQYTQHTHSYNKFCTVSCLFKSQWLVHHTCNSLCAGFINLFIIFWWDILVAWSSRSRIDSTHHISISIATLHSTSSEWLVLSGFLWFASWFFISIFTHSKTKISTPISVSIYTVYRLVYSTSIIIVYN